MQGFLLEGIKYVADHIEKTPYQLEMMRAPGYFMKTISDSTVQELLREREMDTEGLAKFLLYMDDKEIYEKVVSNCSSLGGRYLYEEMLMVRNKRDYDASGNINFSLDEGKQIIENFIVLIKIILARIDK